MSGHGFGTDLAFSQYQSRIQYRLSWFEKSRIQNRIRLAMNRTPDSVPRFIGLVSIFRDHNVMLHSEGSNSYEAALSICAARRKILS